MGIWCNVFFLIPPTLRDGAFLMRHYLITVIDVHIIISNFLSIPEIHQYLAECRQADISEDIFFLCVNHGPPVKQTLLLFQQSNRKLDALYCRNINLIIKLFNYTDSTL